MFDINNIYNCDCMTAMPQMQSKSIDLIIADIPYGYVTQTGEVRAKYTGQLRNCNKAEADIQTFNTREFLKEITRLANGSIYIFCAIEEISMIYSYFKHEVDKDFMTRLCVWKKNNPAPSNGQHMWLFGSEYIIFAKRRKALFNQHCKSNVFEFNCGKSKIHPTEKPVDLIEYLITSSSNEGETVLDPVMGSGTSIIASLNTNRNYIGFELNQSYFETAQQRILQHTKGKFL